MKSAPVSYDVVSFLPTQTSSTRLFGFGEMSNYALYCSDSAYKARTIAIRVTAYNDDVRTATLVDRAPTWAKAAATAAAARNGMNMGFPFGLIGDKEKRPGPEGSEGARMGTLWPRQSWSQLWGLISSRKRGLETSHGALNISEPPPVSDSSQ